MSSALLRKRSNSFNDLSISSKPIIVLKIGSASLSTLDGKFINLSIIVKVVETIASLRERGFDVILVTSGAVSIGCQKLNITERPKDLTVKQAIAAVGQCRLMRIYEDFFSHVNQPVAQVLLSRENLSQKHHYTNALNTFHALFKLGVVPIVNENDTVAVEELKFGDNDTLSALVASLVSADWLFLLTDVDALYSADPRSNPDAKPIRIVESIDDLKVDIGSAGNWGTGGMATKIQAARIGTAAGVRTGIIKSTRLQDINAIMKGEEAGTVFTCTKAPLKSQKRWIAHGLAPVGTLIIDDGAVNAIKVCGCYTWCSAVSIIHRCI